MNCAISVVVIGEDGISIYENEVEINQSEGSIKAIALAQLWKCTSAAEVHSRSDV